MYKKNGNQSTKQSLIGLSLSPKNIKIKSPRTNSSLNKLSLCKHFSKYDNKLKIMIIYLQFLLTLSKKKKL